MKEVIILRGIPGSGKSTYAKKLVDQKPNMYKRINRDSLREMFDNNYFSKGNEKFIKQVRDLLIVKSLEEGKHVIVDDTNLSSKNINRINLLVSEFNKNHQQQVVTKIIEMETSLQECIRRDSLREKPVGASKIRQLYFQFYQKDKKPKVQDSSLPKAIMCDLDGTLSLMNGRNPFDASSCEADLPNEPVVKLVKNYYQLGYKILLVSGRNGKYKPETIRWLEKHEIHYDQLNMRAEGDSRKDSIVKKEIFANDIEPKYFIEFVLDDRNQVVDVWRQELNLPCLQVNYGDF